MSAQSANVPKRIRSVSRAVEVLREFSAVEELTLKEIASRTDTHPTTIYHLVQTLVDEAILSRDPQSKRYRLGPGLLSLVPPSVRTSTLLQAAEGAAYECAQATGFDVWVGVLESDRIYYIARVDGANALKLHMPLLKLQPAHAVSPGRVILSGFPRERARALLQQHALRKLTPSTCTDLEALLDAVDTAREEGWAEVVEEHIIGASDIAVPIHGRGGVVLASLSIGAPSHVFDRDHRRAVLPSLLRAASVIGGALGNSAPVPRMD